MILDCIKHSFLLLLFSINCFAQPSFDDFSFQYKYFNTAAGYYEAVNQPLYQDSIGFTWFNGSEGLYRFDGTHMELMISKNDKIPAIEGPLNIVQLNDAVNGNIWIQTMINYKNQIINYNPAAKTFQNLEMPPGVVNVYWINNWQFWAEGGFQLGINDSIVHQLILFDIHKNQILKSFRFPTNYKLNSVTKIIIEKQGNGLWLAARSGLIHLDIDTGEFSPYAPEDYPGLWNLRGCDDITYDFEGKLWLDYAFGKYLYCFDPKTKKFDPVYKKIVDYKFKNIRRIIPSSQNLWIVDGDDALLFLNTKTYELTKILTRENSSDYIGNISTLLKDRFGNVWVGGDQGIVRITFNKNYFSTIKVPKPSEQPIMAPHTCNILMTKNDQFWLSWQDELLTFDFKKKGFSANKATWLNGCGWSDSSWQGDKEIYEIFSLDEDGDGNLWMSSVNCIQRWNPITNQRKYYWPLNSNDTQRKYPLFKDMVEDDQGFIWGVGMESGIVRIDPDSGEEFVIPHDGEYGDKFALYYIPKIYKTKSGSLFLLAGGHIIRINIIKDINRNDVYIDEYTLEQVIPDQLFNKVTENSDSSNLGISYTYLDGNENFWMTIPEHGIYEYNILNKTFKKNNVVSFLNDQKINNIISDNKNRIWILTHRGLYCYLPENQRVYLFSKSDGLPSYGFFFNNTCVTSKAGNILLWLAEGIVTYNPDSLIANYQPNKIVLTQFQVNNENIYTSENGPLKNDFLQRPNIKLAHTDKMFSMRFSVLNTSGDRHEMKYRYKLEGFDENWIIAGNRNYLAYSNLNPGNYVLRVNASKENFFFEGDEVNLKISVARAPWLTWWAFLLYSMATIGAILLIIWEVRRRDQMKVRLQMEHLEVRKMKELDELKTQFFANISHELRTPLTLILGPLKQMREGVFKGDQNSIYEMMIRNGNRLLKLINQLLDFSKLEVGVIPLQAIETDLISFSKMIFANFESTAQTRNIRYFFQSDTSELLAYVDKKHLEKILLNLLSNAFKFTPDNGEIFLQISKNISDKTIDKGNGIVELQVVDSGIGIEPNKIPYIFDRFYQAENNTSSIQEGTGIGLALVNELVKLHHGTIHVLSNKKTGSRFIVRLPLGKAHLLPEEIVGSTFDKEDELNVENIHSKDNDRFVNEPDINDLKLVLLVEDNADMRQYITECLKNKYKLIESVNGEEGLKSGIREVPDLIISDIMMPNMDGYELCHKLKTDERTSHIPIVLLTAKADEKSKLEGLEFGADDYLIKPFNIEELQIRINNLIEQREKLRKRFSRDISLGPKDLAITSADEIFLNRAIKIIDEHREDSSFNAERFSHEIGLSRSQLHRKLKALTDQSANVFIRSYRLNYARLLIDKKYGNVAEISYAVGFNNPSYFAECFKKQFGMLPSDYHQQSKTMNTPQ